MATGVKQRAKNKDASRARNYGRLSQPEMLQKLRDFKAGRYKPRNRRERYNLNRRLREYEAQGIAV